MGPKKCLFKKRGAESTANHPDKFSVKSELPTPSIEKVTVGDKSGGGGSQDFPSVWHESKRELFKSEVTVIWFEDCFCLVMCYRIV